MGMDQVRLRRGGVLRVRASPRAWRRRRLAPAPQATGTSSERYAKRTWASFEAMTDDESGLPADIAGGGRLAQRADLDHQHRRLPVERRRRRASSGSSATPRGVRAARADHHHARVDGALPERPVLQLVRPPHRARSSRSGRRRRRTLQADPLVGRQRLARGRASRSSATASRARAARRRALRLHGLGLYYRPRATRCYFHIAPDTPPCRAATTRSSARADRRPTSASRAASSAAAAYFGRVALLPRHACDWSGGDAPGRPDRTYFGVDSTRARCSTRACGWSAELGRQHVRGADAVPLRAGGATGRRQLGREPPAHRAAQIHHGMDEAGYGYWGFSPANRPEGGYSVYGVDGIGMDPNGYPSSYRPHAHRPRLGPAARAARRCRIRRRRPTRTAS